MLDRKPSILVIDAAKKTTEAIQSISELHVESGSFGSPYSVALGSGVKVIDSKDAALPGYKEADGFVIDLRRLPARTVVEKRVPDSVVRIFTSGVNGRIDPRPYVMAEVREDFDRVLQHGGILIIFSRPVETIKYVRGTLGYEGRQFYPEAEYEESNYGCLSGILHNLTITEDHGTEMSPVEAESALGRLIGQHLAGGEFSCKFQDQTQWKNWKSFAVNKYGECVAAGRFLGDGLIMLLPTLADEASFTKRLFSEVLPDIVPAKFPNLQRATWALRRPYESDVVIELQCEADRVRQETAQKLGMIDEKISQQRSANAFLFELVRGTGDALVQAVKTALAELGFKNILDVDEQIKAESNDPDLREDLQIGDRSPLLTVDVKGLLNFPTDADALQAHKHAAMRIQEQQRFDVQPLTIINHQRVAEPLARDNEMPFRPALLKVAEQVKLGMLTAWDLHRLVRNARRWGWTPDQVIPVLYRIGRIHPIPTHYRFVGLVEHFYDRPQAASIRLSDGPIMRGGRLSFEFPVEFFEMPINSLQVDKRDVDEAMPGTLCGVITPFHRADLPIGTRVYRVDA